jgi:hypothetical protein
MDVPAAPSPSIVPDERALGWRAARGREDERSRLEHFIGRLGSSARNFFLELFPIDGPFGGRLVASRLNKFPEFGIGNVVLINPEAID